MTIQRFTEYSINMALYLTQGGMILKPGECYNSRDTQELMK
jgi:hypothetical protein